MNAGSKINLGRLVYRPHRNGSTIWEIGIPDRKASEFYVPSSRFKATKYHQYSNKVGVGSFYTDRFRQYGLWKRYRDLYPLSDLVYTIGKSNHRRDWFFAHVPRCSNAYRRNKKCFPTTWQIIFNLHNLRSNATYTLHLALASANYAQLEVRFNNRNSTPPHFNTGLIGRDNAVARHGTHGIYRLYSVNVTGDLLVNGRNTVYLKQSRATDPFREIMYDYIRFEAPGSS
ncbi:OLC1v1011604C1 [Oldenlandia corymbosa var. corymbosa]|uniref:OLC1v1011604C1 n=1 Tax=Oldenlandia corymbosa var. corymbosa TaxID=529605 RepID=A0AAV1DU15_OLDCO|nr:OLC1v1011604C1 [Oldenlandia corymbosa var. corymbosa]